MSIPFFMDDGHVHRPSIFFVWTNGHGRPFGRPWTSMDVQFVQFSLYGDVKIDIFFNGHARLAFFYEFSKNQQIFHGISTCFINLYLFIPVKNEALR